MNSDFNDFCKGVIVKRLPELIDMYIYGNELPPMIVEPFETAGSITNTSKEAKDMALRWFDDIHQFLEVERAIYGEPRFKVLKQTEQFLTAMVSYGVASVLKQSMLVYCNWDIEFRLSEKAVEAILRQIKRKNVRFNY